MAEVRGWPQEARNQSDFFGVYPPKEKTPVHLSSCSLSAIRIL